MEFISDISQLIEMFLNRYKKITVNNMEMARCPLAVSVHEETCVQFSQNLGTVLLLSHWSGLKHMSTFSLSIK